MRFISKGKVSISNYDANHDYLVFIGIKVSLPLIKSALIALPLLAFLFSMPSVNANQWEALKTPFGNQASAIGSYANGCLQGGLALPVNGQGYQVIRTQRQRYYGHPELIEFITQYAMELKQQGLDDILIADMSMPRGGNFSHGHSSHQIGLDVDIWFKQTDKRLTDTEREQPKPLKLVNKKQFALDTELWSHAQTNMVKLAAEDKRVARIFVSPVIKQYLCDLKITDDAWLNKVRPWWGHTYHMHVRLHCPSGDKSCLNQAPIASGNGCNELSWWKQQYTQIQPSKPKEPKKPQAKPKPKAKKVKPKQCSVVLAAP